MNQTDTNQWIEDSPVVSYKGKPLVTARQVGNLMFTSGFGCNDFCQGHVGADVTPEEGYRACQNIALRLLNAVKEVLGSLDRVDQLLFAFGLINSDSGFYNLDRVFDGFSDTMYEALGERGICPRTVGGTNNLPAGNTVAEIEMILSVRD